MLDKIPYTPGMREVLKLSKAEAGRLGHDYIGPEHYLLAIIRKRDGLAVEALTDHLKVDLEDLKEAIEASVEAGKGPTVGLFSPNTDAKRVLEEARAVANSLKHGWVGTEHLLIGLTRIQDTAAYTCLGRSGVTYEKARLAVLAVIEGDRQDGPKVRVPVEGGAERMAPRPESSQARYTFAALVGFVEQDREVSICEPTLSRDLWKVIKAAKEQVKSEGRFLVTVADMALALQKHVRQTYD